MAFLLAQPCVSTFHPFIRFPDAFSAADCTALREMGTSGMEEATLGVDQNRDPSIRRTRVGWLHWHAGIDWVFQRLSGICDDVRRNWYPSFTLTGMPEALQLTHYSAEFEGHYGMHRDMGDAAMSTRKLSLVVLLSDPSEFQGGELVLESHPLDDGRVALQRGTVVAFPSWERHCVLPVTWGERWSLVAWVHGPPWS